MSFEFLADRLPFGYSYNFENYLFNKVAHINTQGIDTRADFFLVNHAKKRIEAKVHFLLKDGTAYSPYKSLFGSYEMNPRVSTGLISDFVAFTQEQLASRGIRSIRIVHPAVAYNQLKADKLRNALTGRGYVLAWRGINHHIPVDETALMDRVHSMEARRLWKCERMGLQCQEEDPASAGQIFEFIAECRHEQGLEPSISLPRLQFYLDHFPVDYVLFGVRDSAERLYAATVAIRVCRRILYNFLPASPLHFRNLSPTVMLIQGLYSYCQRHRMDMLDLGISTTPDGRHQETLAAFKEHMGGLASEKWEFVREL